MKLLLINKDNPMPEGYKPQLCEVSEGYELEKRAAADLKEMMCRAFCEGIRLRVFSAYRSISYQRGLFNEDVDRYMLRGMSYEDAYKKTSESISLPGCSEHNAGLAADISSMDWEGEITTDFENTPEFRWLSQNAHTYGFILRYPKGKENITGITYEPWHYRHVGRTHAACINRLGLTLEEYLQRHRIYLDECE